MIIYYWIKAMFDLIAALFSALLPNVYTLPFGLDAHFSTAIGWVNSFLDQFWPLQAVWVWFLWYLFLFELPLLVTKIVLGSRTPVN